MQTETSEVIHLRHDLELFKKRMLRRLLNDTETLSVGLSSMQGSHPRPHVLQDKVERVLDSLLQEIDNLRK
jgi:hypothetical protein